MYIQIDNGREMELYSIILIDELSFSYSDLDYR